MSFGQGACKILVHVLSDEGSDRCQANRDIQKNCVECGERCKGLIQAVATSHPVSVESHVPVGQVLKEVHKAGHHSVKTVCLHLLSHKFDQLMHGGVDPKIHHIFAGLHRFNAWLEFLSVAFVSEALLNQEAVGVVPWQENILDDVTYAFFLELQGFCTNNSGVQHVHSHSICSMAGNNFLGVRIVLQALGHFLAVSRKHQAVHDKVLERWLIEEVC
mmetsp:Transcript_7069/g.12616  ORF Transcript_7069/g.12616 Transcript_7069/m.12616 type:complete len:217 (-) Transcript_7069:1832-2482(-)